MGSVNELGLGLGLDADGWASGSLVYVIFLLDITLYIINKIYRQNLLFYRIISTICKL